MANGLPMSSVPEHLFFCKEIVADQISHQAKHPGDEDIDLDSAGSHVTPGGRSQCTNSFADSSSIEIFSFSPTVKAAPASPPGKTNAAEMA